MLTEQQLSDVGAADLRLTHAEHFLELYIQSSGPPTDAYWLMVGYFDAFLFFLSSVIELADDSTRQQLLQSDTLRFIKVLRNISTHRSILAAPGQKGEYPRPMMRIVGASIGATKMDSSQLYFNFVLLDEIVDRYAKVRPSETKNVVRCRKHIEVLKSKDTNPELREIMLEALDTTKQIVRGT